MLAVVGGKGGCGKTTTTACLGRAFADRGADPIVVDADRDMPDLHVVAGGDRSPGLGALAAGAAVSSVSQSAGNLPGVGLVAAGDANCDVEDALAPLADRTRPVVVDTPAGASEGVAGPLRLADCAVLVSAATTRSLADAAKTAAMARTLGTPIAGVVLTRSDGRVDPSPLLEVPTLVHVPRAGDPLDDERVRDAYARGTSMITERNI